MKTNEQMIEDLLKRKEAYDKKRAANRRRAALISAALAIILIVSSIPVIAFVANKKTPELPEVTAEAATDKQTETDGVTVTEEQSETTTENTTLSNETAKNVGNKPNNDETELKKNFFNVNHVKIGTKSDNELLYTRELNEKMHIIIGAKIYPHEDINEYKISVTRAENYSDNKAYLLVIPSISIELLSQDLNLLSFENSETNTISLKFKYKEGFTNGRIEYLIFNENDGLDFYSKIDGLVTKRGLESSYEMMTEAEVFRIPKEYKFLGGGCFCVATVKNYDFERYNLNTTLQYLYVLAAEYFNDLDSEGSPLYKHDPYMQDYYDNPYCYNKRLEFEMPFIKIDETITRGNYETAPSITDCMEKPNTKNATSQYVYFYGDIYWTDISGNTHPAKNITVKVYNSTGTVKLCETSTSQYGFYYASFPTNETNSINVIIKAFSYGQAITIMNFDNNSYECNVMNINIPINSLHSLPRKTFSSNSTNPSESLFNNAISAHQALNFAKSYANSICSDTNLTDFSIIYSNGINVDANYNVIHSNYDLDENSMYIEFHDAFDWDVIEHEYGHYLEDVLGFSEEFSGNNDHNYYADLRTMVESNSPNPVYYTKEKAIKMAWKEGWATFFAINSQRISTNSNDPPITNVNDNIYNDIDRAISVNINGCVFINNLSVDLEFFADLTDYPDNHTIYKGETNEITVAALLFDLVDGINMDDVDITCISDSIIWSIIIGDETDPNDGCVTLSGFLKAFQETTLLTGSQKIVNMYLLGRYELNPYNLSVTNVSSGSPLVTWTNISANCYNRIRVFDTSFNEICSPIFISYQTSYNIPAATWNQIKSGRTAVYIVVEGMNSSYPITAYYYSSPIHVSIP